MEVTDNKITAPGFEKFSTVQDILEQNKILINEINTNHDLRSPEALARNVVLIRELNNNTAKVVELYKDISSSFEELGKEKDGHNSPRTPANAA